MSVDVGVAYFIGLALGLMPITAVIMWLMGAFGDDD